MTPFMRVDQFDFDLPEDRIALYPAATRDGARMLHVAQNGLIDRMVTDLSDLVRDGDVLVVNNTQVIPAQLAGLRPARDEYGADIKIDVTLHKDVGEGRWRAFGRPAKRLVIGDRINFGEALSAEVEMRDGPEVLLVFNKREAAFHQALADVGAPPLPPYIARKRDLTDADIENYQTVFARDAGSVAAPTAGLHFTASLLESLRSKGASIEELTLHVGAGTFLPVSVDDTGDHKMHSETGFVPIDVAERINKAKENGGRIIAVGTTSLRLLESATNAEGQLQSFAGDTDIFITPGYKFKIIDCLMTNFHLPRSTLFMLVSAFSGLDQMKNAYAYAIDHDYRFYSYGDACFLEKNDELRAEIV